MRTEEKVFFGIGTASFLLMLSDLLLEVFSASLFIGSKRLISYIGILIIVCAVSFTVLCFLVVKNHRGRFKSKGTRIFLRVLSIIICIMLCLAGITVDGILYTDTVKKATSDDKRHTIIIDSEPDSGEWNMTVYRRYSPFLMSARGKHIDMHLFRKDAELSVGLNRIHMKKRLWIDLFDQSSCLRYRFHCPNFIIYMHQ